MGENIGTTVTSNLAALTANTQARRAAMAHMVFTSSVFSGYMCFPSFINMVCDWVGYDVTMPKGAPGFAANAAKLSFVLLLSIPPSTLPTQLSSLDQSST